MRFRTVDLAAAVGGTLHGGDVEVTGATTDSRAVASGALFVPIVAERDGHDFVAAAVAAGAGAVLTARAVPPDLGVPAIAVADTGAALLDVGRLARRRLRTLVVGITGSVGKTSVKDLAAAALATRFPTAASERSFNNELGVPLTLANAPDGTRATVVEMGARGVGHVALLCDVAHPTVGVVTRVAAVHTEAFGSIEAVARSKGELIEALPAAGTAVLNADDWRVAAMATRTPARVLAYSAVGAPGADVVATAVVLDDELRPRFRLVSPWGEAAVALAVRGEHQVGNALAAAAAALACGCTPDEVAGGLAAAQLSPWRMELGRTPAGALVLNDAYNANPTSMAAALHALAALPARRRVAVLGVMAELGPSAAADHDAVAGLARQLGVAVVAVGTDAYGVAPVDGVDAVVAALGTLGDGDAVLVKASRVAGLEHVAAALLAGG
ncbi:MAG: UDP-N-acetylmuramoyl-tripeptide--D-alanyl-D-alanine ligase [Acidimicrobiales bacterium]